MQVTTIQHALAAAFFLSVSTFAVATKVSIAESDVSSIELTIDEKEQIELAIKKKHPSASAVLGLYYLNGIKGIDRDEAKGVALLTHAAEQGFTPSQMHLFTLLMAGGDETPRDLEKAVYWLEQAANANDPRALHKLGEVYDPIARASPISSNEALAQAYRKLEVTVDGIKAHELYEKSAKLDYPKAMAALGHHHLEGKIVPENKQTAASLYEQACEKGYRAACDLHSTVKSELDEEAESST